MLILQATTLLSWSEMIKKMMGVGQGKVFARASGKLQLSVRSTSSLESNVLLDIYMQREGEPMNFYCSYKDILYCVRENSTRSTRLRQAEIISSSRSLNSHLKALIMLLIEQNEENHIWTEYDMFVFSYFGFDVLHICYAQTWCLMHIFDNWWCKWMVFKFELI